MKHLLKILALLITIGSFSSCVKESSLDVNQDKIYTDYELFYNSNTDKTVVVASFRFGGATGTLLELDNPAFVTFNGDTLAYNFIYRGHAKEYAGQLSGGTFSYTDGDENIFTNSTPTYESIQFPSDFSNLKKSEAYDLHWEGSSLSIDQWVGIWVGSWTWGKDAAFLQNVDGSDNIILGVQAISNLPSGTSTVFMDRATAKDVAEGTSEGGRIRSKFRANNVEIMVED